ncbi:MAG: DUF255 domain-containing protein [Planctomycetota bacterium]|nr:MAG: DUF255 domain-containing protein [Planctomycetota bacterium]
MRCALPHSDNRRSLPQRPGSATVAGGTQDKIETTVRDAATSTKRSTRSGNGPDKPAHNLGQTIDQPVVGESHMDRQPKRSRRSRYCTGEDARLGQRRLPWAFALSICLVCTAVTPGESVRATRSTWHDDFDTALSEARRLHRPLLVHFYAEWCGPCRIMEAQVLSTPAVTERIRREFVAVKVDFDRRQDIARRYGVNLLPTDLILTPDGKVISRSEGLQPAAGYQRRLASIAAGFRPQAARPPSPERAEDRTVPTVAGREDLPRRPTRSDAAPVPAGRSSGSDGRTTSTAENDRLPAPELPDLKLAWQKLQEPARSSAAGNSTHPTAPATGREDAGARRRTPEAGSRTRTARKEPTQADTGGRTLGAAAGTEMLDGAHGMPPLADSGSTSPSLVHAAAVHPDSAAADASATRQARKQPARPEIGLEGYSPVALYRRREWIPGRVEFAHTFRGVTYYLATAEELELFRRDPVRYAPRLQGCDPVVLYDTDRAVAGSVRFAAYFDDELYLFVSEETRTRFERDPLRYTRTRHVRQDRRRARSPSRRRPAAGV